MGMDVYGKNPSYPTGEYFRASIWAWPGIVEAMKIASPQELAEIGPAVLFNDSAGLDHEDAFAMGGNLLVWLDDNLAVQRFSVDREVLPEFYRDMHDLILGLKRGTIVVDKESGQPRPAEPGEELDTEAISFSGGPDDWDDPFSAHRTLVEEFAEFAIHSGGFRIE